MFATGAELQSDHPGFNDPGERRLLTSRNRGTNIGTSNLRPWFVTDIFLIESAVYRERRRELADVAQAYQHGHTIPHITYTPDEINTWLAALLIIPFQHPPPC